MTRFPQVSWKEVVRALEKSGFVFGRQKGSHMVYYHPGTNLTVVVPRHGAIKKGTLREIIRQTGLDRDDFIELLTQ